MIESVVPEQWVADLFEFYLDVVGEAHLQALLPLGAFTGVVQPILVVLGWTEWLDWAKVPRGKNQGISLLYIPW